MKKLIIALVFTFSAALTTTVSWAEAIGTGALNTFGSGNILSSTDMNTNFTAIKDAVNASNALQATLPDGESTSLSFYVATPFDYTTGQIAVYSYWSGCEGAVVRMAVTSRGYSINNSLRILDSPSLYSLAINTAPASNFTIKTMLHLIPNGFSNGSFDYNFMVFTLSRRGVDSRDTCSGDLRLWGASITYPDGGLNSRIFIPAHAMTR